MVDPGYAGIRVVYGPTDTLGFALSRTPCQRGEEITRPRKTVARIIDSAVIPADYPALLSDIKQRIRAAQVRATLSANRELIHLYWDIGRVIAERQERQGWVRR